MNPKAKPSREGEGDGQRRPYNSPAVVVYGDLGTLTTAVTKTSTKADVGNTKNRT
jgi:hypothetical protein